MKRIKPFRTGARGFSLVEVVLAISIAVVILVVAIYFYHQISNLRTQLIEHSERLGTIRLLVQKMATDFRAIDPNTPYSFIGNSNMVSFTIAETRIHGRWTGPGTWSSGLYQVTYRVNETMDGTNLVSLGIVRDERAADAPAQTDSAAITDESSDTNTASIVLEPPAATNTMEAITNLLQQPLTELVRALEFKFWNGSAWTNEWRDAVPPRGITVTLATEDADPATGLVAPDALFRRVIFVPPAPVPTITTNTAPTIARAK